MNTLEAIHTRRSYRGTYSPNPVPREDLMKIMEAGCAAPSGCNKQTTSFLAVDDPELLKRLHSVIQPPRGETAPAMICVLTRRIIAYREGHGPFSAIDGLLNVNGIGEATLAEFRDLVSVGAEQNDNTKAEDHTE